MSTHWTRRQTLKSALGGTAAMLGASPLWAQGKTLNILSHRVHQVCLTEGPAGDLLGKWRAAQGATAAWTTFDSNPLQDRLFREASLGSTDFGVGYLVSSRATPTAAKLLLPLDDYLAKAPIEDFGDIAQGMVGGMRWRRYRCAMRRLRCSTTKRCWKNAASRHHRNRSRSWWNSANVAPSRPLRVPRSPA
jgi:multiple sugar transport system substrate-binding protein